MKIGKSGAAIAAKIALLWMVSLFSLAGFEKKSWACFSGDTLFLTPQGVQMLQHFNDKLVRVRTITGAWEIAEVKSTVREVMNRITIGVKNHRLFPTLFSYYVTPHHLWYLEGGGDTTSIAINQEVRMQLSPDQLSVTASVVSIQRDTAPTELIYCVNEPITQTFTLNSGVVTGSGSAETKSRINWTPSWAPQIRNAR